MEVRVVKAVDGVYDIFDIESERWIFSQISEWNVLLQLAERRMTVAEFMDKQLNISCKAGIISRM